MKIVIFYRYNGAKFCGSQTQPNGKAVEDALNLALRKVGIFESVVSSSRTDTGVHALFQASTTHCGDFWDLEKLQRELNRHLPFSIRVMKTQKISEDFHARYSAKARSYRYLLAHGEVNVFLSDFVYFCPKPDINKLNLALSLFKGEHDFSGFYKLGSDEKSPIRKIFNARARSFFYNSQQFTMIYFKANGFLRSQVRMMVANALKAANDKQAFEHLKSIFLFKNNQNNTNNFTQNNTEKFTEFFKNPKKIPTKIPAPAQGLYLKKVFY